MNSPTKKEALYSFLLVFAGVFLLYGQTLGFGFVWDDHIEVLGNTAFHQWSNFGKFFTVPYWTLMTGGFAPYHRPMIPIMILLVSTFFGNNPFGYHLLNLLLYAFTVWIFFLFLRRQKLSLWISIVAVGIFLLHPAHAETVSWGSARPVLLSGLCFIACLYFSAPLSFLIFSIGLLSYHSILTLVPFLFLYDLISEEKKTWASRIKEYSGYVLLAAGFIFYCLTLFHKAGETDLRPFYSAATANMVYTGQAGEALLAPLNTLTRYSEILFFPLNLVPDATFHANALSLSAIGAFILMTILTLVLFKQKTHTKPLLLSLAWMACGILTVANFVPQGGLFADRYTYISSFGFALWAALLLNLLSQRTKFANVIVGILFVLLSLKTITYSPTWKNDFNFWLEASILSPERARAHDKLGILLESSGHSEEAVKEYEKVLSLDPEHFAMTHKRLAEVLKKLGRLEEAKTHEQQFEILMKKAQAEYAANPKGPLLRLSN